MKLNFGRLFDDKRFLMVFSVVLAIVAWLIVVYAVEPNTTQLIRNVPVSISEADKDILALSNLDVVEGTATTVNVLIEGKRLDVSGITESDVEVKIDLAGISSAGTYTPKLIGSDKFGKGFTVEEVKPGTVRIRVDRMLTKKFSVTTDIEGLQIPDGYIGSEPVVNPKEVTITGPEADINKIDKCVVSAQFSNPLTANKTITSDILLYDSEGTEIPRDLLTMEPQKADITVQVLKQKSLPVDFTFLDIPAGFPDPKSSFDYVLSKGSLVIAGPESVIDSYEEAWDIGYVNINEITKDKVFMFDIALPNNFMNVEDVKTISLQFDLEEMVEADYTIPATNIKAIHVPVNYEVTINTPQISGVHIIGDPEAMATLSAQDLIAEIDLSERELTPGPYNLPVRISAPRKGLVWATGEYAAVVTIKEK